ncbi:AAA family ATPase [Ideonella sp. B508-1]|uniref:AAA family ATPase n=1 Tax=Ideonella sp. B508-1 TaxID=137716 RepID=UPI0003B59ED3|nr:AAA family ATPase [Ideonella sp. B508-1]
MWFRVEIQNIPPVLSYVFEVDLDMPGLLGIVGGNGTGKTTLAKSLLNLAFADTFIRTSSSGSITPNSRIVYRVGDDEFTFSFEAATRTLTTRIPVPEATKRMLAVELPAPYGQRFTFFGTLVESDAEIRRAIVLGQYARPDELIAFLNEVYGDERFDGLVEIRLRRGPCCCFVQGDDRYLREDYFSSGEYFLIHLFRLISAGRPLVFIDEIDTSLDARAQARLAVQMRLLANRYHSKVVFTTHSLALMQTLEVGELAYLERTAEEITLTQMSFNSVKSILFGFRGSDRYLLTEDEVLKNFLEYVIRRYCPPAFFSYQIIYIGGADQVTDLMRRNRRAQFFGPEPHVISVLDGDQNRRDLPRGTICIPLHNVEQALWDAYRLPSFQHAFDEGASLRPKPLYERIQRLGILSAEEINCLLCDLHDQEIRAFAARLSQFLCRA